MEKVIKDGVEYNLKIFKCDNAVVRVYAPILTEEEHERRMKRIHDAAAELLKDKIRNDCRN